MPSGKNGYESSLIGLARSYGNYFEDNDGPFGAETWKQVIYPDTHELVLVQSKRSETIIKRLGDWRGRKCYEYFEGISSPCTNCHFKNISRDNFQVSIKKNTRSNADFFIESILIDHCGKPAVFQKVIDVTDTDYRNYVMEEYIQTKNLTTSVLGTLMEESHITENFETVCRQICEFFNADRALITEYVMGKLNTTYSRLSQPFTQVCTELSDEAIADITAATATLNYIWVPDVPNDEKLDKSLREYWSSRGIKSILLIPMSYNGSFIGTVSLHNIREHVNAIDAIKLLGMAVAKCIHSYVMEAKAEKQLYSDPLTGALNLSGFQRRAYELFREYPDNDYYFCAMDIRYFGGINRRYGFELGDRILVKTARTLADYLDEDEAFCRISADVFCLLAKFTDEDSIRERFTAFAESMQCFEELTAADNSLEFQCGAYIPDKGDTGIAQAIDKANLTRLALKDEPGSSVAFFSKELLEKSKRETELLQDFRAALSHGELTVFYQPQCNYSSQKIVGAEALVRWKSPKHGNVSPADFIPLLERHGLIYDLDRFVWEDVCRHQQRWIGMGYRCPISINMSRHDVLRNNIVDELCMLLDRYGVPKELLPLEITETAYIKNSEELIGVVDTLKEAGFTVEMDDFGSGYSSLNALKDVSVDLLKLDMKFLDMGERTDKGSSILNCIVRMTRWLDLAVLAEGVETQEQAEYLKNIGCDLMQGYYFARPMPAEDFESILVSKGMEDSSEKINEVMHPDRFMEALVSNPVLFNNMGAAAIAEYCDGVAEALMVNDSFLEMLDMTRDEYTPYMKDIKTNAANVIEDISSLRTYKDTTGGVRTWECSLKRKNGQTRRVRIYCRALLDRVDRSINLICIDDITSMTVRENA